MIIPNDYLHYSQGMKTHSDDREEGISLNETSAADDILCSVVNCCRKFMLTASSRSFHITGCVENRIGSAECCRLAML